MDVVNFHMKMWNIRWIMGLYNLFSFMNLRNNKNLWNDLSILLEHIIKVIIRKVGLNTSP